MSSTGGGGGRGGDESYKLPRPVDEDLMVAVAKAAQDSRNRAEQERKEQEREEQEREEQERKERQYREMMEQAANDSKNRRGK